MFHLPIAKRELLSLSKARKTYRDRMLVAGIFAVIGSSIAYFMLRVVPVGVAKLQLFQVAAFCVFLQCLSGGMQATADSLTKERRDGTLGLLFLTDLKARDIVVGKLIASSALVFYLLLAIVPVFSLAMLFGGVGAKELGKLLAASVATVGFAASLGLFSSALFKERRGSTTFASLLGIVYWVGIPSACTIMKATQKWPLVLNVLWVFNINGMFMKAGPDQPPSEQQGFWAILGVTIALGLGLLWAAVRILPNRWQDKPAENPSGLHLKERFKQLTYGGGEKRTAYRRRLLDMNAFFWLAARDRMKPAAVWCFLAMQPMIGGYLYLRAPEVFAEETTYVMFTVLIGVVLKGWYAVESSRALALEKEGGTMELLICTPLQTEVIAAGQLKALRRQFFWPMALFFGWVAVYAGILVPMRLGFLWIPTLVSAGYVALYLVDLTALHWIGLWSAMRSRYYRAVSGAVLMRGILLPTLAFLLLTAGTGAGLAILRIEPPKWLELAMPVLIPGLWGALSLGNAIFWRIHIRRELPKQLASLAAEAYVPYDTRTFWLPFRRKRKDVAA